MLPPFLPTKNAAIAIAQTINYVQLRYLTQMLDATEHVSTQKRTRAMSNTFLSDMLSRGVKKTSGSTSTTFPPAKLTNTSRPRLKSLLPLANSNKNFSCNRISEARREFYLSTIGKLHGTEVTKERTG